MAAAAVFFATWYLLSRSRSACTRDRDKRASRDPVVGATTVCTKVSVIRCIASGMSLPCGFVWGRRFLGRGRRLHGSGLRLLLGLVIRLLERGRLLCGLVIRLLGRSLGLSSLEDSQPIDIGLLIQNVTMTVLKLV